MRSRIHWVIASGIVCVAVVLPGTASAQRLLAGTVVAELERNRDALRTYAWKSRTEVTLAGEVTEVTLFDASYADGEVRKIPLLDGRMQENPKQKKKIVRFQEGLKQLIAEYIEVGTRRLKSAFTQAKVTESGSVTLVQTRNVIRQGDSVKIFVEPSSLKPRRFEILTSVEGEAVQLTAEFVAIDDGPSYPARIVVVSEIKEKPIVVTTENFDFVRR